MIPEMNIEVILNEMDIMFKTHKSHNLLPFRTIRFMYRMEREDIIKRYDLSKGEFRYFYAMYRGRL